jgi:hypothetical protein
VITQSSAPRPAHTAVSSFSIRSVCSSRTFRAAIRDRARDTRSEASACRANRASVGGRNEVWRDVSYVAHRVHQQVKCLIQSRTDGSEGSISPSRRLSALAISPNPDCSSAASRRCEATDGKLASSNSCPRAYRRDQLCGRDLPQPGHTLFSFTASSSFSRTSAACLAVHVDGPAWGEERSGDSRSSTGSGGSDGRAVDGSSADMF